MTPLNASTGRAREFEATHLRDLEQGDLGTRGLDLLGEGLGEGTDQLA
jgi:hypothetical protein